MKLKLIEECHNVVFANCEDESIKNDIICSIWYGVFYEENNDIYYTYYSGDLKSKPNSTPIYEFIKVKFRLTDEYKIFDIEDMVE